MALPDKAVQEFKEIFKKNYGKELSDSEARDAGERLVGLMKLLIDIDMEDRKRKRKLKDYPKGFHYEDGKTYSCLICHKSIKDEEVWYDDCGHKCMTCQRNLNKRIVPKSVFKNRDSWWSSWDLENNFGINKKEARVLVKEGKLKARELLTEKGKPYMVIYLKKDNPQLAKYE